jgi:hypothetical protein
MQIGNFNVYDITYIALELSEGELFSLNCGNVVRKDFFLGDKPFIISLQKEPQIVHSNELSWED